MDARVVNRRLSALMPVIVPSLIVLGVAFPGFAEVFVPFVTPVFACVVFAGSVTLRFREVVETFRHPVPMIAILLIVHILMPVIAWAVAHLGFAEQPDTIAGIILQFLIPTASTGFAWVAICGGNLTLTLATVFVDTILAPFAVPLGVHLLIGAKVSIDTGALVGSLTAMILIPSVLAVAVNEAVGGAITNSRAVPWLQIGVKVGIWVVIISGGTRIAPVVRTLDPELIVITLVMFGLSLVGYAAGLLAARVQRLGRPSTISSIYGAGLRNINAGAVIAVAYFPPATVFPVVISMLFQQTTAGVVAWIIRRDAASGLP